MEPNIIERNENDSHKVFLNILNLQESLFFDI